MSVVNHYTAHAPGQPDASEPDWDRERAAAVIEAHAGSESATLPMLHAMQAELGFIPEGVVPMIAAALNLSRAEIHGVVTFYHDFRRHPPGRAVLRLCRAEACQSRGADALAARARERLGLDWHGTTPDGALTLEPVYCLGLCASAPNAMLDDEVYGRLDEAALDALLDEAR